MHLLLIHQQPNNKMVDFDSQNRDEVFALLF